MKAVRAILWILLACLIPIPFMFILFHKSMRGDLS